jgi:hypothetical protein
MSILASNSLHHGHGQWQVVIRRLAITHMHLGLGLCPSSSLGLGWDRFHHGGQLQVIIKPGTTCQTGMLSTVVGIYPSEQCGLDTEQQGSGGCPLLIQTLMIKVNA